MIKPRLLEARSYQIEIAENGLEHNTLICMPSGLGKKVTAALIVAEKLKEPRDKRAIVLAPTKPRVSQYLKTFRRIFNLPPQAFTAATGLTSPEERVDVWGRRVVFSTPQILMNDIVSERIDLSKVSTLIFDEAHRCVQDSAYTFIAERYSQTPGSHIIGLTASLGSNREHIDAVMKSLYVDRVEVRSIWSRDVKPYISKVKAELVKTPLPKSYYLIRSCFEGFLESQLSLLNEMKLSDVHDVKLIRMKTLLKTSENIRNRRIDLPEEARREALSKVYSSIHALKSIELIETEGMKAVETYIRGLESRYVKRKLPSTALFLESRETAAARRYISGYAESPHPKMEKLAERLKRSLSEGAKKIMIFTNYSSTASEIVEFLNSRLKDEVSAVRLIGEISKSRDTGLSKKEQTFILDDFKGGVYNVLVATQIGEESLERIGCDEVVFYDTSPSAIKYIQHHGRKGRGGPGRVTILMAEDTRDERYFSASQKREKRISEFIDEIARESDEAQPPLEKFEKEDAGEGLKHTRVRPRIIVDSRESGSPVVSELSRLKVDITLKTLVYGDFILSEKVVVERKTAEDFSASIIDGRLFEQASNLRTQYERPILLIEGPTLYTYRNVRPESIFGAVSSLLIDYATPVIWTQNPSETALLLCAIARREQSKGFREPRIRSERKPMSKPDLQEFIIAGLPNVDSTLAKRLLNRFKTVENIFKASSSELREVEGIGEKKSKLIRDILTSEYKRKS